MGGVGACMARRNCIRQPRLLSKMDHVSLDETLKSSIATCLRMEGESGQVTSVEHTGNLLCAKAAIDPTKNRPTAGEISSIMGNWAIEGRAAMASGMSAVADAILAHSAHLGCLPVGVRLLTAAEFAA